MKNKITVCMSALAGIFAIAIVVMAAPNKAVSQEKRQGHQVVVMWLDQDSFNDGVFRYNGATIYCSSSSKGAPTFPQYTHPASEPLTTAADGMAMLLNEGFEMRVFDPSSRSLIFVK